MADPSGLEPERATSKDAVLNHYTTGPKIRSRGPDQNLTELTLGGIDSSIGLGLVVAIHQGADDESDDGSYEECQHVVLPWFANHGGIAMEEIE